MNELAPTEFYTERSRIAHDIALDAHVAIIEGDYRKFRDNLSLLDEMRCYDLSKHLKKVWRMYE